MASITLNKNSVPGECIQFQLLESRYCICSFASFLFFFGPLLPCFRHIGDKSALVPGGIRIGSPAMTTRGFSEKEFVAVADFIHEGVQITQEAKKAASGPKLQDFMKFVTSPSFPLADRVSDLQRRVEALTTQFPIPGL